MTEAKDYREIIDALRAQHFVVEPTERGHYKAIPPDKSKPLVHFAISNDPRGVQNTIRDLRKAGLVWPWDGAQRERPEWIAQQLVDRDASPKAPERVEPSPAPAEREETNVEILWSELKGAKEWASLAEIDEESAADAVRCATVAHERAKETLADARRALREAKERFDRAFAA